MKKLQDKIYSIIDNNKDYDYGFDGENETMTVSTDVSTSSFEIANEAESIAIDFANYKATKLLNIKFNDYIPTDKELFSDFIEERYKE